MRPFTDKKPKPLVPLLGLRLIEWVILSAREAGIEGFVIVTGYLGGKLKSFLGDGSRYNAEIEYVDNSRWKMGNGISVYEARNLLEERFVLLMSDHIFNPDILSALKRSKVGKDECILCVDKGMSYVFDADDATKVKVVGGEIVQIGKSLEEYDGVDMGMFLCAPDIFKALKQSIGKNRYSLTAGIRELAKEGKMKAYCIENEEDYWIDIDTFESLKIAERILLTCSQTHVSAPERLGTERIAGKPSFHRQIFGSKIDEEWVPASSLKRLFEGDNA